MKKSIPQPGSVRTPAATTVDDRGARRRRNRVGLAVDKPAVQRCRICGCTDADCSQCVERTGTPCHWVASDLCSACEIPLAFDLSSEDAIQAYRLGRLHGDVISRAETESQEWLALQIEITLTIRDAGSNRSIVDQLRKLERQACDRNIESRKILNEVLLKGRES